MTTKLKNRFFKVTAVAVGLVWLGVAAPQIVQAAAIDKERSESFLREAQEFIKKGDGNAAVIQLKNALQSDPGNVAARRLLGEIYLRVGNGPSAEKEFVAAMRRGANDTTLKILLARSYLLQGKNKEALEEVSGDVTDEEVRPDALIVRGQALLGLRDFDKARTALIEADKLRPEDVRAKIGLAQSYVSQGKIKEGEAEIDEALGRKPESVEALVLKGELRRLNKDLDGAVQQFDKAVTVNDQNLLARLGRAASLIDLGKDQDAQTDLDVVFRRVPKHPLASYLQALVLAKKKDYAAAQETLQQAGPLLDNHMPSVFLRGAVSYALNQYEQAVASLERYTQAVPTNDRARKLLGATLVRKREAARAIEVLEPLVNDETKDAQLLTLLGSAYMQVGKFNEGTAYFSRASEAAPDVASIRMQQALGSLAQGESEAAVGQLENAINLDPEARQASVLLALVKLRQRDFDGALVAAKRLQEQMKDNPLADNLIGAAYLGKGDRKAARETFEAALGKKSDFHPARMNLAQLDLQEKRVDEAKKHYETIIAQDAKHVGAMMAMANIASDENDSNAVVSWLKRASEANPDSLAPELRLIQYYSRNREFQKAVAVARGLSNSKPDNPRVLEALGRAQTAAGDPIAAVQTYQRLASLNPESAAILGLVAGAQISAKDPEAARGTLKDAIALDDKYLPAKIALVELESAEQKFDEALRLAEELKKEQPDSHFGELLTGDVFMRQNKFAEAAMAYDKAIVKSDTATLAIRRFNAKRQAGKADEALKEFQEWVDKKDDRGARHVLASAYLSSSKNDEAIREAEKLLANEENNPVLLNNLAWLYQQKNDKRALDYGERAYKAAPKSAAVIDTLGWILVEQGHDVKRGAELLAEAHQIAPKQGDIQYHLAYALNKNGQTAEAKRHLERLIESGVEFQALENAKTLLKQIGG
jgi:putative PEP-CTERM system TPR-repeat lipoprotein